jgi:hypothetical protein
MHIRLLALAILLFASSVALSQQPSTPPSQTEHAQGRGCVRPARKEGCYVLHDIGRRRYWDLNFTGDSKPGLYTHIWFEGIGYPHDAHCDQGRPVHVSSWKVLPGECSRPAATQPKAPSPSNPQ